MSPEALSKKGLEGLIFSSDTASSGKEKKESIGANEGRGESSLQT